MSKFTDEFDKARNEILEAKRDCATCGTIFSTADELVHHLVLNHDKFKEEYQNGTRTCPCKQCIRAGLNKLRVMKMLAKHEFLLRSYHTLKKETAKREWFHMLARCIEQRT